MTTAFLIVASFLFGIMSAIFGGVAYDKKNDIDTMFAAIIISIVASLLATVGGVLAGYSLH